MNKLEKNFNLLLYFLLIENLDYFGLLVTIVNKTK